MAGSYHAHASVLAMCDAIDEQFVLQVGPFGSFVAEETRARWLAAGNKINATHEADLGVEGLNPKSANELHQLAFATERLRTSMEMAAKMLRSLKKPGPKA